MATAHVEERELLKAMSWWDGFVVALANPGFLIAALGASIGTLGTTGAFVLWTVSVCLGAGQNIVGTLIQAEWFSDTTWSTSGAGFDLNLAIVLGCVAILVVWITNIFGVRPAVWLSYVTGALLMIPAAVLMFLPYVTGDWSADNMQWNIGSGGGLALAMTWLYFMGWSS